MRHVSLSDLSLEFASNHQGDGCHAAVRAFGVALLTIRTPVEPALLPQLDREARQGVDALCVGEHCSILLRKHDREHAGGLLRVSRIFRPELTAFVVVVDLPKELLRPDFKAAKVVLPMWIVVGVKFPEG